MLTCFRLDVSISCQVTDPEHVIEIADDIMNANLVAYKNQLASPSPRPTGTASPPPIAPGGGSPQPPRSTRWAKKKKTARKKPLPKASLSGRSASPSNKRNPSPNSSRQKSPSPSKERIPASGCSPAIAQPVKGMSPELDARLRRMINA